MAEPVFSRIKVFNSVESVMCESSPIFVRVITPPEVADSVMIPIAEPSAPNSATSALEPLLTVKFFVVPPPIAPSEAKVALPILLFSL